MNSTSKHVLLRIIVIVFAGASIYFSYISLRKSDKVEYVLKTVIATVRGEQELGAVQGTVPSSSIILASSIVDATNKARLDTDPTLPALVSNSVLARSAQAKVDDMVLKNYFEHETPEGYNVEHFIDDAGYEYITVAENLASGDFVDAEALVTAWMNSPGHRANILNHDVTEIGVAISYVEFQGRVQYVAVQHFGRPRSNCPSTDEALNNTIHTHEAELESMERELDSLKKTIDAEGPGSGEYATHIEEYNQLVNSYNALSQTIKNEIETYNLGVRAFNECIGSVSVSAH